MAELHIEGKQLRSSTTIKIRWPHAFGFRMWLTKMLILTGGQASPVTTEIVVDEAQDDKPLVAIKPLIGRPARRPTQVP